MIIGPKKGKHAFYPLKMPVDGVRGAEKRQYRVHLERALIVSLFIVTLGFSISRRIPRQIRKINTSVGPALASVDLIPITQQGGVPRPPNLPQIPIPTEDEYLPDDETIEDTSLELFENIPMFDGFGRGTAIGGGSGFGPRPIREVIPEYPKEERSRGAAGVVELFILVNAEGYVDSVRVLVNTTRSSVLEKAAIRAARMSQYVPATRDGRNVPRWIKRPYRFEGR
jgi:TonB family protein